MKHEKTSNHDGQHDVHQPHQDNYDVDPRKYTSCCLQKSTHHDHRKHDQRARPIEQQQKEIFVVGVPHAIANPWAMVVHFQHTGFTHTAMV